MVNGHMSPSSTTASPDRRQRRASEIRERLFRAALDRFVSIATIFDDGLQLSELHFGKRQ